MCKRLSLYISHHKYTYCRNQCIQYCQKTNLWSKLSCQLDSHWLGIPRRTLCQLRHEVRQVGGHGVGLAKTKSTWKPTKLQIFAHYFSMVVSKFSGWEERTRSALTVDIQSGWMWRAASSIGCRALIEATVLNRHLTNVDVADDLAVHRDILPNKNSETKHHHG